MKSLVSLVTTLFWLALGAAAIWLVAHTLLPITVGPHLLDWVMGTLCLLWLIVILKVPWDLYFEAQKTLFEMQRSHERGVAIQDGREAYVRRLSRRLGWAAVGAHIVSAAGLALLTWFAGHAIGYYFAVFYLISTFFRPLLAGYVYLREKLRTIGQEVRYPREDVVELRERVTVMEGMVKSLSAEGERLRQDLRQERSERQSGEAELRTTLDSVGREMERSVSRLTDNQEVISGIQAFVRLISQAGQSA